MKKIINFIKLDLITIKPYCLSILIGMVVPITFIFMNMGIAVIIGCLLGIVNAVAIYPFSVGNANDLDILYSALPLNRKDVVRGRYAFAVLIIIFDFVIAFCFYFICNAVNPINLTEFMMFTPLIVLILSINMAFQYVLYFKFGYIKAKIFSTLLPYISFILIAVMIFIFELINRANMLDNIFDIISENLAVYMLVMLLLCGLFQYISYVFSKWDYVKRDL